MHGARTSLLPAAFRNVERDALENFCFEPLAGRWMVQIGGAAATHAVSCGACAQCARSAAFCGSRKMHNAIIASRHADAV